MVFTQLILLGNSGHNYVMTFTEMQLIDLLKYFERTLLNCSHGIEAANLIT